MNNDTNSALLKRAKGGDRDALGNLLNRYRPYLRILALRYLDSGVRSRVDPSDVIQQTCLDIHRDIDGFRGLTRLNGLVGYEKYLKTMSIR